MNPILIDSLRETQSKLNNLIVNIDEKQFFKKRKSDEWSIAEIVEHLCLIEEAYMREFFLALNLPENLSTANPYATVTLFPEKMKAKEAYTPIGRFARKEIAIKTFNHDRNLFITQITNCNLDLTSKYTYRDKKIFQTLHEMVLANCIHTTKHTNQLRNSLRRK